MVTMLLLLVALFCSSFTYRKGSAASTMLFVPRRILGPVMGMAAVPIHSQFCVSGGNPPPLLPSSSLPWQVPHSTLHLAAALLAESSPGQWVGLSPACLSNFLFPHRTSFQRVQRWAVPNLELFIPENSTGFLCECHVSSRHSNYHTPSRPRCCLFLKNCRTPDNGEKKSWGDWWSKESSKR